MEVKPRFYPPFLPLPSLFLRADRPSSIPDHFDGNSSDHSFVQLVHIILLLHRRAENEQSRDPSKYANRSSTLSHWRTLRSVRASFHTVHNWTHRCRRCCAKRMALVHLPHTSRCKKVPGLFPDDTRVEDDPILEKGIVHWIHYSRFDSFLFPRWHMDHAEVVALRVH
jgi:hypothetical protein